MDKQLLEKCIDIFYSFERTEEEGFDFDKNSLRTLISSIVDEDKRVESICNPYSKNKTDQVYDLDQQLVMVSFSIGYLTGQLYDITNPKVLKGIEDLKDSLRNKNHAPFFPIYPRQKNVSQP